MVHKCMYGYLVCFYYRLCSLMVWKGVSTGKIIIIIMTIIIITIIIIIIMKNYRLLCMYVCMYVCM